MDKDLNYNTLKNTAHNLGASLFGVAKLTPEDKKDFLLGKNIVEGLDFGISIGYGLSQKILDTIYDRPNKIYFFHYRLVNQLLDFISLKIVSYIQEKNYQALPIPASQIIDWENQKGAVSHRKIAYLAGQGEVGKNNLLVSPLFGSQVRFATILTNIPLTYNTPIENNCGKCRLCIDICPAKAISERREDFDKNKCFEQLKKFSKEEGISQYICGLCVKICKSKNRAFDKL